MSLSGLNHLPPRHKDTVKRALAGNELARLTLAPHRILDTPDPWQREALFHLVTLRENSLMLCSRKGGKSFCVGAACCLEAYNGGFALVLSRSDRQAMLVIEYVRSFHRKFNLVEQESPPTAHELKLSNGGHVLALPCREDTIRGYHNVTLLVIDEAARIPDPFYGAATPMMDARDGRMVLLSTPFGQRGFFWEEWEGKKRQGWKRHRYDWTQCPRLTSEFIRDERDSHGDVWIRQEYELEFCPVTGGFFNVAALEKLCDEEMDLLY